MRRLVKVEGEENKVKMIYLISQKKLMKKEKEYKKRRSTTNSNNNDIRSQSNSTY